jgi:hypothetical protein
MNRTLAAIGVKKGDALVVVHHHEHHEVSVKTPHGTRHSMEVPPTVTVLDLKKMLMKDPHFHVSDSPPAAYHHLSPCGI